MENARRLWRWEVTKKTPRDSLNYELMTPQRGCWGENLWFPWNSLTRGRKDLLPPSKKEDALPMPDDTNRYCSSSWKKFLESVLPRLIPQQADPLVPVLLQTALGLTMALASPFDNIHSPDEGISTLGIKEACVEFMPGILLTAMLMVTMALTLLFTRRSRSPVPAIAILLVMEIYYAIVLLRALKPFAVSAGGKKMPASVFTLAAAFVLSLVSCTVIILLTFLSWQYVNRASVGFTSF